VISFLKYGRVVYSLCELLRFNRAGLSKADVDDSLLHFTATSLLSAPKKKSPRGYLGKLLSAKTGAAWKLTLCWLTSW